MTAMEIVKLSGRLPNDGRNCKAADFNQGWELLVIDRTPNTFGKSRTEPSAEIGPIYRTRSAVLAEHSSVGRTIVRQKNSSVRFGSAEIGFGRSLIVAYTRFPGSRFLLVNGLGSFIGKP